ncbi:NADP-dependent oxidoreductase [Rhizobium sp. 21-4511-3d]
MTTSPSTNRRFVLEKRPETTTSVATADLFRLETVGIPELQEGQFLVENHWMSLDPWIRGTMNDSRSYQSSVGLGEVMRALCAGRVIASRHPDYPAGTPVSGMLGWQEYAASDGSKIRKVPRGAPLELALNILGINGQTAWFGIHDIGKPKAGETAVVTAAAGGVGSIAVQLLKAAGCRVIGLAGDDEKCAWVKSLGAAECINYKTTDIAAALHEFCPDRVDVVFDNVGGAMLDELLLHLNTGARIVLSGALARYNATPEPLANWFQLHINRATMKGYIFLDHFDRFDEADADLMGRWEQGDLQYREHIIDGLENAPDALRKLFDGTNRGKLLVKIKPDAS